ncbi:hypothetical protein D0466_04140 [Peribacillus glennii]|uniref:ATPase dynein-related AAA domain-containing protein n=2 Tax=Peribacillus glennii TaxID=2303991 RepID=A0A372LJ13_9BACI|nr:AAA family ATPase [Peribacillus glennii]RFU66039.1 hypothetical protein D0466_04140 [Peribacillus glennii]
MEVDILSGDEKAEDKQLIKLLLKRLAENKNELRTLSTNNPNWITKVNDAGIYVENETSREKFTKGEKKNPFSFITYDFLLTAWEEFIKVRSASTKDFIETKGSSSFIMGFFHELPFVETELKDNNYFIKLKEFTTDRLPESTLKQTLKLLTEIINEELDPKTISQKFKEDSIKRLKLRARQGLKILGFLSEEYKIQQQILNEYIDTRNTDVFLSKRMLRHPYLKITYQLLSLLTGIGKAEKVNLLTEIGMVLVRNSLGSNLMVHSVAQNRTRNILNWFKEIGLVDEEWNVLDNKFDGRYTLTPSASLVREEQIKITIFDLVNHINQYIANKGFFYRKEEVINLFLSLKTKPFVIISGISGTGKTKIVQWFAESVGATEKNGQFTLIPVRPDWSDSSDLLGYVDIKGDFKKGKLTEVILNARENENLPYFVLLDEMNLARVEYYFSDLLSVMESRKWDEGEMVSSTLLSEKTAGKKIILPNNLYIIGTVNMDETTHPFSKKVLDRANTIEFNRVELGNLSFLQELDEIEPVKVNQELFASKYLHLKDAYKSNEQLIKTITDELILINNALQRINAHIGYRVRDEICFYLSYNEESQLMPFEQALDHCILQKILPRIAGSDGRVETLLKELFSLFTRMEYVEELDVQYDFKNAPYPASAAKVVEMLRRLQEDGFTSFWIS